MSAQTELPRPGVEVIQVFRTVSPTITTPTLVPCVIGACKQIVEATVQSAAGGSTVNSDAIVTLPAFFISLDAPGATPTYVLPNGALQFSVNNHIPVAVYFEAGNYKPSDVVNRVREALDLAGETEAIADIVGSVPTTGVTWRLRTIATGEFQQIEIDPNGDPTPAVITGSVDLTTLVYAFSGTFDITINGGAPITVPIVAAANAAALVAQINVAIGAFALATLGVGNLLVITTLATGLLASLLVDGSATAITLGIDGLTDTGDGSTAALISIFGLNTRDLFFGEGSYAGYEVKIPTRNFPDPRLNIDELAFEVDTIRAFIGVSGGGAQFEALRTQATLRKGGAVTAIDDGNGDNLTPFLQMAGQDFTSLVTVPTQGRILATAAPNFALLSGKTLILSDGRHQRTVQFGVVAAIADVEAAINAVWNTADGILADNVAGFLRLTCTKKREDGATTSLGEDSNVVVMGGSGITPINYVDTALIPTLVIGRFTGSPQRVDVGDEVYVDGAFIGKVLQVAPGGNNARLKVDRQVQLTFTGLNFYIIAKMLAPLPTGSPLRPAPDLIVTSEGDITLKLGILRDTMGKIVESITVTALIPGKGAMYVSYRALRLDVTSIAQQPGLLRFNTTVELESLLDPISADNPLALGLYFALLNAPAVQCTGLGIDAISADSPFGTVESFTRAAEYLEAFEVYALAPLTHDTTVGQVFRTHVDFMSDPTNKGERIVLFNPSQPTNKLDTLVTSSTNGNTVGATGLEFDTGVGNLSALLLAAGIDPTATIPVADALFLDIASNNLHYSVASISGSVVTIRVTFVPPENDDGFYSTTDLNDPPLPTALIEEPFALRIRGAALTLTNGSADKDGIADTYAALGQSIIDRRYWQVVPDRCQAVLAGLEQLIDGFYMTSAIAGMIGQQPPQQSFTNFPMTGFTTVVGSNNFFSDRQMNRMAGGGNYIIIQEAPGAPLISRMALTTDLTSIETRTDSITKIVDFTAKFLRRGLKNFIGRFNITQGFLDSLGHVLEGLLGFLKEAGVLLGADVNNIVQDETTPDTVIIDIVIDPPYPCNYIRVTLVI